MQGLGCAVRQRPFEDRDDGAEPRLRANIGVARVLVRLGPHRGHDRNLVAHRVEDHHQRGPQEDRVGHADRVGLGRRQPLHLAHHVVAEIAEDAGCHRRQFVRFGGGDARFGDQGPQRDERRLRAGHETLGFHHRLSRDLGAAAAGAKHDVGIEPDHRVAAAHDAALHGFQQEATPGTARRQLQEGRDRGLEIGDQGGGDELRFARGVPRPESLERWKRHQLPGSLPSAVASAFWLMVTPTSAWTLPRYCCVTSSSKPFFT